MWEDHPWTTGRSFADRKRVGEEPRLQNQTPLTLLPLPLTQERRPRRILEDLTHALPSLGRTLKVVLSADLLRDGHTLSCKGCISIDSSRRYNQKKEKEMPGLLATNRPTHTPRPSAHR